MKLPSELIEEIVLCALGMKYFTLTREASTHKHAHISAKTDSYPVKTVKYMMHPSSLYFTTLQNVSNKGLHGEKTHINLRIKVTSLMNCNVSIAWREQHAFTLSSPLLNYLRDLSCHIVALLECFRMSKQMRKGERLP